MAFLIHSHSSLNNVRTHTQRENEHKQNNNYVNILTFFFKFSLHFFFEQVAKFCFSLLKLVEEDDQLASDYPTEDMYVHMARSHHTPLNLSFIHTFLQILKMILLFTFTPHVHNIYTNSHAQQIKQRTDTVRKMMITMKKVRYTHTHTTTLYTY